MAPGGLGEDEELRGWATPEDKMCAHPPASKAIRSLGKEGGRPHLGTTCPGGLRQRAWRRDPGGGSNMQQRMGAPSVKDEESRELSIQGWHTAAKSSPTCFCRQSFSGTAASVCLLTSTTLSARWQSGEHLLPALYSNVCRP